MPSGNQMCLSPARFTFEQDCHIDTFFAVCYRKLGTKEQSKVKRAPDLDLDNRRAQQADNACIHLSCNAKQEIRAWGSLCTASLKFR